MRIIIAIASVVALTVPAASQAEGEPKDALERAVSAGRLSVSANDGATDGKSDQVVAVEIRSCIVIFKTKILQDGFIARMADFRSDVSLAISPGEDSISFSNEGRHSATTLRADGNIRLIYDQLVALNRTCRQPVQLF